MRILIVASALVGLAILPAAAQEAERYRLERTDTGFVRMDMTTGQMSICEENAGEVICRNSADEPNMYESRITELERRVDALERQFADGPGTQHVLPTDQEFEQSLGYMRRFFQSFFDIVEDWERGLRTPQAEPEPDRT